MGWNYLSISKLQRYYICILQVIELVFTHFDVEPHWGCKYDNLTVFDGASTSSPSLGTYCGNQIPDPVTTSGNTATILFMTDVVMGFTGFSIDFTDKDLPWTTTTSVETTTAPPGSKNLNIGPGYCLVLPGNKSTPEAMLTKLYDAIWRHLATMGWWNLHSKLVTHFNLRCARCMRLTIWIGS